MDVLLFGEGERIGPTGETRGAADDVDGLTDQTSALIDGPRQASVDRLLRVGAGELSADPDTTLVETDAFPGPIPLPSRGPHRRPRDHSRGRPSSGRRSRA